MEQLLNTEQKLFEWICRIEPHVKALYEEIKLVRDNGGPYFCANELWYGYGDSAKRKRAFKRRVNILVGWGREAEGKNNSIEAYLESSEAYDLVYQTLYNMLPDCRNCDCMNFQWLGVGDFTLMVQ